VKVNLYKNFKVTNHTPVNFIIFTDPLGVYEYNSYVHTNMQIKPYDISRKVLELGKEAMLDEPLLAPTSGSVNKFWTRTLGAYKIAHECRLHGYTVQVIDWVSFHDIETLMRLMDKYVGDNTLALGMSNTFSLKLPWMLNLVPAEMPILPLEGVEDIDALYDNPLETYMGFLPHGQELDDKFVRYVKNINNNVKFVKGGTWTREDNVYRNVDIVNIGWGDVTMPEILKNIEEGTVDSMPIHTKHHYAMDLTSKIDMHQSTMSFLKSDALIPGEQMPLETARGCIFKCKFCSFALVGKEKGSYLKDVENVRRELEENYYEHGITDYWIVEDTFNDDHDKIVALHKLITSLPFDITFSCYLRTDMLYHNRNQDPPQHQLLLEMGLRHVEFGLETTNPESAKDIGKGMNPILQLEYIKELKRDHGWQDVLVGSGFLVGLPSDTKESLNEMGKIFTQADFPIDSPMVRTMKLNRVDGTDDIDKRNNSEFSLNWEKYGYEVYQDKFLHYPKYKNKHGIDFDTFERFIRNLHQRRGRLLMPEIELTAKGAKFPGITDEFFAPGEFKETNREHLHKLVRMQSARILHYQKTLLTQDL